MQRHSFPILALLTLGLALPAQDTTVAQSPALVIRTTNEDMANGMMQTFEVEGELPKLEKDQHWLLTLDSAGKATIKTAAGATSTLEIDAQPPALMTIYKDQIEQQQQMASMMGMMMLQQMGLDAGDAAGLIKDVFDFPNQVATFQLRYKGDPENAAAGFDVNVELQPKTGAKFAAFCTALKPNPQGVALAAREAALNFGMSVDLPAVMQQLAPLMSAMAAMSAGQGGDAKATKELSDRMVKLMDGTFSLALEKGIKALAGVTDGAKLQQLMESPEYIKMHKESGDGATEYVPAALTHNGIKVAKTVMTNESFDTDNPLFKDGKLTLFSAIAGQLMVMASTDTDAKQLIDASKDAKRGPLPGDAMIWANLKIQELSSIFGDGPEEGAPKNVEVQLAKKQSGLNLKVIGK